MTEYRFRHISFLSDYGESDEFAGVCRGVMLGIAPEVTIVDITHSVEPFQIARGAILLARAVPYLPHSVHLAVVDPGVGSDRRPVAIQTRDRSCLIGPDNGLLIPAAEKLGGVDSVRVIENPGILLPERSHTFHGRDIFAPAAAHIARGVPLEQLGSGVDPSTLVALELPAVRREGEALKAIVLHRDHFGNLELNVTASDLAGVRITTGARVEVQIGETIAQAMFERMFSAVPPGELVLFEDSHRSIALAVNSGSAADRFSAGPGLPVVLRRLRQPEEQQ